MRELNYRISTRRFFCWNSWKIIVLNNILFAASYVVCAIVRQIYCFSMFIGMMISTHWILDRRRVAEAMKEDLEYVDIDTLTKIKMWYYNSTSLHHPRSIRAYKGVKSRTVTLTFLIC